MGKTTHTVEEPPGQTVVPGPRIAREQSTIRAMIGIFCRDHHAPDGDLCCDCQDLLAYAHRRLEICPFQEGKPACNLCEVHCYSANRRQRIKEVMRYAGPRMLLQHPVLALLHVVDKRRAKPKTMPTPKR